MCTRVATKGSGALGTPKARTDDLNGNCLKKHRECRRWLNTEHSAPVQNWTLPRVTTDYAAGGWSNPTVQSITRRSLNRAVNDLADLIIAIYKKVPAQ